MNIDEIKEWWAKLPSYDKLTFEESVVLTDTVDFLLAEIDRLTAILTSHGPEGHNVTNEQFVEMRELAKRLADDALVELSAVVCTPAEGYFDAPHCLKGDIKTVVAQLQTAEARAAQHLADQDYMVAMERKRVARDILEIIDDMRYDETDFIIQAIREKYGVENET